MKENIIDEVLLSIREAEAKADETQQEASDRGKDMILAAEAQADRLKNETTVACKDMKKQAVQEAQRLAAERREAILKAGEVAAKNLIEEKNSAVEEAADKVVAMLLEKYR